MRSVPRTRHYVSPGALTLCRPLLSFDYAREAYVLRGIGDWVGPVLREDRRGASGAGRYTGPERRGAGAAGQRATAAMTATRPRSGPRPGSRQGKSGRDGAAAKSARGSAAGTPPGATRGGSSNGTPPGATRDSRNGTPPVRGAGNGKAAARRRRSKAGRGSKRPRG